MIFYSDTRSQIYADMVLDHDPTGSTIAIKIDGTTHTATWQGTPVQSGNQWKQTALTVDYFAGPGVAAGSLNGAMVLTTGMHDTETLVTSGGTTIAYPSNAIDVRDR